MNNATRALLALFAAGLELALWGTYRMTLREAVISWAKEAGSEAAEQLAAAEERLRDARRAISKALREAMQREADAEKVVSIEERMRRSREATGMAAIGQ